MFNIKKSEKRKSSEISLLHNRFTMKLPNSWKDQSIYRFEGPEDDGIQHNIYVTIEHDIDNPDLKSYATLNIKAVEKELQGYQELKQGPLTLANGTDAFEVVYKWSPVEKRNVYQRTIYLLMNKNGYVLTATFSKKTWKTFGPEVDKILMSFSVPEL